MTYNVFGGTLNLAQSNPIRVCRIVQFVCKVGQPSRKYQLMH